MYPSRTCRTVRAALLGGMVLAGAASAGAQPAQEECEARLERARGQYEAQQFAEVERLVVECVDRQALPAAQMEEGFRLLTLAYLRENLLADAQTTVIKHLAWSFSYEPDEVRDPPLYVALVRVTKAQLTVPPAALLASAATAGAPAVPAPENVQPASPEEVVNDAPITEPETQLAETSEIQAPSTDIVTPTEEIQEPVRPSVSREPALQPAVRPSDGTAALALRERDELRDEADAPARTAPEHGVGLMADGGESNAGGGRYGGGLSAVPGTNPTALLIPLPADARSDKADPYNETLDFATVMPEIIGGPEAIRLEYPDFERRRGIEGRVVVRFVVDEAGDVSEAEVLRGVGPGLDAAALAALRRLRFMPARQNGQPARVRMTLTFRFQAPGGDSAG